MGLGRWPGRWAVWDGPWEPSGLLLASPGRLPRGLAAVVVVGSGWPGGQAANGTQRNLANASSKECAHGQPAGRCNL